MRCRPFPRFRRALGVLSVLAASCHPADAPKALPADGGTEASVIDPPPTAALDATFDAEQKKSASTSPADLHFTIAVAGGKARFLQGDPIPIELSFSSDVPKRYRLDKGLYDRIGRMSCDQYVLDRTDTVDPLAEYFENGFGGMGGLRQEGRRPTRGCTQAPLPRQRARAPRDDRALRRW
ncbi:hypothetical protein BH09MYX1_BH09MYX1_13050 [soil metagenome]